MGKFGWVGVTIFVPDRLSDCNRRFLVRVLQDHDLGKLNAESVRAVRNHSRHGVRLLPVSYQLGKLGMAVASQQFDGV